MKLLLSKNDEFSILMNCAEREGETWFPQRLSHDKAFEKMVKNTQKAIHEHFLEIQRHVIKCSLSDQIPIANPYAVPGRFLSKTTSWLDDFNETIPLSSSVVFSHEEATAQGQRPSMEDYYFYRETEEYILAAVFDGHGGPYVASFADRRFARIFQKYYESDKQDIRYALEASVYTLQRQIECLVKKWERGESWSHL